VWSILRIEDPVATAAVTALGLRMHFEWVIRVRADDPRVPGHTWTNVPLERGSGR
jgi:hypothetical protein